MRLNAPFAGLATRLMALATQASGKTARASQSYPYAMPQPALQPPLSDGKPPTGLSTETLIHRRAMRQNNRKPEAVAAFVARHQSLRRGC